VIFSRDKKVYENMKPPYDYFEIDLGVEGE